MKRLPILVLAAVGLSLGACGGGGGGGGDQDAFCDGLDALSEQVADGDLASNDGLDDVLGTVNDELLETADDGEQLDAVREVGETLAEADADDPDDTAETIQDELGDFAEDCEIDEFAAAPEVTTTTAPETTTTTEGTTTTTEGVVTTGTAPDPGDVLVGARTEPVGIAPEFQGLADLCFQGDAPSCDQLFLETPVDSADEAYGATCGGRVPDGAANQCAQLITAPEAPPTDIIDQATARSCFDGDMQACDDLFNNAADGTTDRAYGALCGFRVQNTQEFCVPIFGEQAFF